LIDGYLLNVRYMGYIATSQYIAIIEDYNKKEEKVNDSSS
jgi:hypothetical protein